MFQNRLVIDARRSLRRRAWVVSSILCKRFSPMFGPTYLCLRMRCLGSYNRAPLRSRGIHKGAAALLWGEPAASVRASRLLLARNVPPGVGGTRPPRLAPGGGNGKGGDQIPCCRRLFLAGLRSHSIACPPLLSFGSTVQRGLDAVAPQYLKIVQRFLPMLDSLPLRAHVS